MARHCTVSAAITLIVLLYITTSGFCSNERPAQLTDVTQGPVASDRVVAADVAEPSGGEGCEEQAEAYTVLVPFYSGGQTRPCYQVAPHAVRVLPC
jgi:hypothetical protein